jgi:predicted RNA methylase
MQTQGNQTQGIQTQGIQTLGLERNTIDKFYTKKTVVELCMIYFTNHVPIDPSDLILEPSAGNGSFVNAIMNLPASNLFYDIEPEHPAVLQKDYLQCDLNPLRTYPRIHVIGNPPFGRQSSLAKQFILKSCSFCHSVSFILPKSFKKSSLQRCFPLNFHLQFEIDLPDDSFLVNGIEHDVPCIFQIWIRKESPREIAVKQTPQYFRFVKKEEHPDFSFRRVGVNAGTIDTQTEKSIQSHYFIKLDDPSPELIQRLSQLTYPSNNTVGPRSISKQELIAQFNPILHASFSESVGETHR